MGSVSCTMFMFIYQHFCSNLLSKVSSPGKCRLFWSICQIDAEVDISLNMNQLAAGCIRGKAHQCTRQAVSWWCYNSLITSESLKMQHIVLYEEQKREIKDWGHFLQASLMCNTERFLHFLCVRHESGLMALSFLLHFSQGNCSFLLTFKALSVWLS